MRSRGIFAHHPLNFERVPFLEALYSGLCPAAYRRSSLSVNEDNIVLQVITRSPACRPKTFEKVFGTFKTFYDKGATVGSREGFPFR